MRKRGRLLPMLVSIAGKRPARIQAIIVLAFLPQRAANSGGVSFVRMGSLSDIRCSIEVLQSCQTTSLIYGKPPPPGLLARGKGVGLGLGAGHGSCAFVILDLIDNPDFIATVVVLVVASLGTVVVGISRRLSTSDIAVDQPLDELGDNSRHPTKTQLSARKARKDRENSRKLDWQIAMLNKSGQKLYRTVHLSTWLAWERPRTKPKTMP